MLGAAHVMEAAREGDVPAVKAFLDNGGPNSAASLKDEVRALMQYPMCSTVFALPRTAPLPLLRTFVLCVRCDSLKLASVVLIITRRRQMCQTSATRTSHSHTCLIPIRAGSGETRCCTTRLLVVTSSWWTRCWHAQPTQTQRQQVRAHACKKSMRDGERVGGECTRTAFMRARCVCCRLLCYLPWLHSLWPTILTSARHTTLDLPISPHSLPPSANPTQLTD
jgi:hypothetical protein